MLNDDDDDNNGIPEKDDVIMGTTVTSGPNGIAQTTKRGNDVQVIPVGMGLVNADCVSTGFDGISNTTRTGDDGQRIPVGKGEPNTIGITAGQDGALQCQLGSQPSCPAGDDIVFGGTQISTGPDGILNSYADASTNGPPTVMTSDLVLPIPTQYGSGDLDQVRFHLKHP